VRKWFNFQEASSEIGIPLKSFYLYYYRGEGPKVHRFGKHLRILEEDLVVWQKSREEKQ
jgi:hypothetical protein